MLSRNILDCLCSALLSVYQVIRASSNSWWIITNVKMLQLSEETSLIRQRVRDTQETLSILISPLIPVHKLSTASLSIPGQSSGHPCCSHKWRAAPPPCCPGSVHLKKPTSTQDSSPVMSYPNILLPPVHYLWMLVPGEALSSVDLKEKVLNIPSNIFPLISSFFPLSTLCWRSALSLSSSKFCLPGLIYHFFTPKMIRWLQRERGGGGKTA